MQVDAISLNQKITDLTREVQRERSKHAYTATLYKDLQDLLVKHRRMVESEREGPWIWVGDGTDDLVSMSDTAVICIEAVDLRRMLKSQSATVLSPEECKRIAIRLESYGGRYGGDAEKECNADADKIRSGAQPATGLTADDVENLVLLVRQRTEKLLEWGDVAGAERYTALADRVRSATGSVAQPVRGLTEDDAQPVGDKANVGGAERILANVFTLEHGDPLCNYCDGSWSPDAEETHEPGCPVPLAREVLSLRASAIPTTDDITLAEHHGVRVVGPAAMEEWWAGSVWSIATRRWIEMSTNLMNAKLTTIVVGTVEGSDG